MRWHALVVQLDERWKCGADVVGEYLRLFRFAGDWLMVKEDLDATMKCGGCHLDLLIGPHPGQRHTVPGPSGYPTVRRILYVSKASIPRPTKIGREEWVISASISAS